LCSQTSSCVPKYTTFNTAIASRTYYTFNYRGFHPAIGLIPKRSCHEPFEQRENFENTCWTVCIRGTIRGPCHVENVRRGDSQWHVSRRSISANWPWSSSVRRGYMTSGISRIVVRWELPDVTMRGGFFGESNEMKWGSERRWTGSLENKSFRRTERTNWQINCVASIVFVSFCPVSRTETVSYINLH